VFRYERCVRRHGRSRPLAVLTRPFGHGSRTPWSAWRVVRVGKGDLDPERLRPSDDGIADERMVTAPTALWDDHNAYGVAHLVIDGEEIMVAVPEGATHRRIALVPIEPRGGVELVCDQCGHGQWWRQGTLARKADAAVAAGRRDDWL
jgi:hypothetical protein